MSGQLAEQLEIADEVTDYASAVVAGSIVAGPWVRAACERHLQDIATGAERGLIFDVEEANRAIQFFPEVLTIDIESKDEETGEVISHWVPFVLGAWQAFIVGSLFGWLNAEGLRRFRRAYVEIAKGNGKSPLAAGIGHYMLVAMGKQRAEVYSAATDKDQAAILFRDAVAMWKRSAGLQRYLRPQGVNPVWALNGALELDGSFFKPISSDKKGKSGIRPYCALIDEVHEHPDNSVIEMMRAGTKGNQEALLFEITNSGFDKKTVCGQEHDYSLRILKSELVNDAWFAFIASLDEGDEPFDSEDCWIKPNPNLGVSIQRPFIREQVQEARGMPSKEGLVRRLHFCQWTESENSAIPRKTWMACEAAFDPDELTAAGVPCYGGLDLSRTRDLTAFTLTWVLDATKDQWKFKTKTWFWTPADTLKERSKTDKAPYELWATDSKYMEAVPGPRIKYSWMADALLSLNARYHPVKIGADQYGLEQLLEALGERGNSLPAEVHPQGFQRRVVGSRTDDPEKETGADDIVWWMPDSINKLEAALLEQRIGIDPNPVMRMCAGGAVFEQNRTGHRMFDKAKATTRIDGMVALAMSIGVATTIKPVKKSFWET